MFIVVVIVIVEPNLSSGAVRRDGQVVGHLAVPFGSQVLSILSPISAAHIVTVVVVPVVS